MNSTNIQNKDVILIVDDNITNLQIAITMLKEENYEVAIAANRSEAEQTIGFMKPNLILMDVMMPETDGFEFCRILKSDPVTEGIPVVFLTSLRQTEDVVKGFNAGGADFISKPFKKEELLARIKNVLDLKKSQDIILNQNVELKKLITDRNGIIEITAHDLNNPLQAILGMSELLELKDCRVEQQELKNIIGTIKNASKKAIQIIRDLKEIHNLEGGLTDLVFSTFDIFRVIGDLKQEYELIAHQKNISIEIESNIDEYIIVSDENKFLRIIDNILSNAIKFSPKNKLIKIRINKIENVANRNVKIEIIDEGPGITEQDKPYIFTKYAKLTNKPTGGETSTGLGLSIVKLIADKLDFHVDFISSFDKGSNFYIEI